MEKIQINELTTQSIQGIVNSNNNQFTISRLGMHVAEMVNVNNIGLLIKVIIGQISINNGDGQACGVYVDLLNRETYYELINQ